MGLKEAGLYVKFLFLSLLQHVKNSSNDTKIYWFNIYIYISNFNLNLFYAITIFSLVKIYSNRSFIFLGWWAHGILRMARKVNPVIHNKETKLNGSTVELSCVFCLSLSSTWPVVRFCGQSVLGPWERFSPDGFPWTSRESRGGNRGHYFFPVNSRPHPRVVTDIFFDSGEREREREPALPVERRWDFGAGQ